MPVVHGSPPRFGLRQGRHRDPLHIVAAFGLHPVTAQRYADAAFGTGRA